MIRETLYAPFNFTARPSWRAIVKLVALKHGVGVTDIQSASRSAPIVRARHEAIHLVFQHCGHGSPWVARKFDRDPTTVLYAIRKREGKPVRRGGAGSLHPYGRVH